MSLRKAAQQALEALEEYQVKGAPFLSCDAAANALRAALAQGEDTRVCTCHPDDNPPVPCAKKYALTECRKAALAQQQAEPVAYGATHREPITGALYKKIDSIWYVWCRMEDEPRRWIKSLGTSESCLEPLIRPQPAAQWVGLTDEEMEQICDENYIMLGAYAADFIRAIEAKLKEKNT